MRVSSVPSKRMSRSTLCLPARQRWRMSPKSIRCEQVRLLTEVAEDLLCERRAMQPKVLEELVQGNRIAPAGESQYSP